METFLISFLVVLIAVVGMGIGVLFGRPCIKGSCGGSDKLATFGLRCGSCPNSGDQDGVSVDSGGQGHDANPVPHPRAVGSIRRK